MLQSMKLQRVGYDSVTELNEVATLESGHAIPSEPLRTAQSVSQDCLP